MANYVATTRSNYFRVKDVQAFQAWCVSRNLAFWSKPLDDASELFHAIAAADDGWPSFALNEEEDVEEEFCLISELAEHLDPRDIAVLLEIGAEKQRYLIGSATALRADGTHVTLSLSEIYERALQHLGPELLLTEAVY